MSTLRPYGIIIEASVCSEKVKTSLLVTYCPKSSDNAVNVCVISSPWPLSFLVTFLSVIAQWVIMMAVEGYFLYLQTQISCRM